MAIIVNTTLTLDELYTLGDTHEVNRAFHASHMDPAFGADKLFYGNIARRDVKSFAGSYMLPDSARKLYDTLTADLPMLAVSTRRKRRRNRDEGEYIGDYASYETYRAGITTDGTFWDDSIREERKAYGVISVGLNMAISSMGRQTDFEYRAAAALALTDYLEAKGYRVELWALTGVIHRGWEQNTAVCLKDASGMLTENGMAYCAHLGTWRHCEFQNSCNQPHRVSTGYGSPKDYAGPVKVDITVPWIQVGAGLGSFDEAKRWLDETLAKLEGGE